eukprot:3925720-Rhodomonas_salina.1
MCSTTRKPRSRCILSALESSGMWLRRIPISLLTEKNILAMSGNVISCVDLRFCKNFACELKVAIRNVRAFSLSLCESYCTRSSNSEIHGGMKKCCPRLNISDSFFVAKKSEMIGGSPNR